MYHKSVLSNGIRVISEAMPHLKSVSFGVWVKTGSRNEQDHNHGVSHFIEHLMFKGTESRSAKDIAETVDAVGGQMNAYTGKEHTCYYMKVLDTHLDLAVEIISDMLRHSKFAPEDIDKERGVVLEEYNMYEDSPDELVHDIHYANVWADHSLGRNILGSVESIHRFSRDMICDYTRNFYVPERMVIAAAGNLQHEKLVQLAEKYFGQIKPGRQEKPQIVPPIFLPGKSVQSKDTEQAHICVGSIGVQQSADDLYAVHILNNILGGSMSSRLFQSIREERGLAYSVYSYQTNYSDAGLLTVYAGTRPDNTKQVVDLILQNLAQIKDTGVSAAELAKAREQLKGNLFLGLESSSSRMSRLGTTEVTISKYVTLDEVIEKINKVSLDDIKAVCGKLFTPQTMSCTILGPLDATFMEEIAL
ncbi:M16 family metallopeptidase [Acetonema longum]|uniref:Peptidase M16-like protein n=1 Tax=Acetonema longum DSM 6540 TaxID=1009370 RepID=F7NLA7_9FIRM|nr:pitrilysin family protein [Acetonema longum]EGO63212.1 peptidase M16-like protein [Acetonema longum DSM 6540]